MRAGGQRRTRATVRRWLAATALASALFACSGKAWAQTGRVIPYGAVPPSEPTPPPPPPRIPSASPAATLSLPVLSEGRRLAPVTAEVTVTDVLAVSPVDLEVALGDLINPQVRAALRAMGGGLSPVAQVRALGLEVALDPATLSLVVTIPPAARGAQAFNFSSSAFEGRERISPSDFSFGLTGALLAGSRLDGDLDPAIGFGFAGFANLGGVTGINLLFGGDFNLRGGGDFFQRDRLILFKDVPSRATRYSAGDLSPLQARLAGQVDLAGFSFERNYQELQPTRNVRPVGRRSFTLERRSTIEVYSNGALVQSFIADPGPVDIRDIPALELSSNISIVVQDTLGRREIESFSLGNDISLLAAGFSEFSASVGLLRDPLRFGIRYTDDPVASLYYSRGLTQRLTLSGHAVLSERLQNVGASAAFSALGGVGLVETAISRASGVGAGFALGFSYRGDPFGLLRSGNFNLRADYQSRAFRTAGSFSIQDVELDVVADYSFEAGPRTSINFGGSYSRRYSTPGASAGVFVGVQQRLGAFLVSATLRHLNRSQGGSDSGVFLSITRQFGRRLIATSSYDSISQSGRAELRQRRSLDLPEVEWAVRAERTRRDVEVGGNFRYATSRFDAETDVAQVWPRGAGAGGNSLVGQLRLQSGIAYADGVFAIGRDPAQGFAIISRHPSLGDASVAVSAGTVGRELAFANGLGPAVAPLFGAYRAQELTVALTGAPTGYDIGAGAYVLEPGARSGFRIEVGGVDHHVVLATLNDDGGAPVALTTGRVERIGSTETTPFFTNRNGRAAFSGLAPGRYRARIDNSDLAFTFEVVEDDPAIKNLGTVTLERQP